MTLTELRYLIALDRERHFGRAAARVFVSQPTLSVAIKKLESQLNVTIFERGRGELQVTPVGRRVIAQAQKVLSEVQTLESIAISGRDELAGPLRLGVIYTIGPYLLPHLIPALKRAAPDMPLIIEENFTRNLSQQLAVGELDAIILSEPFAHPGALTWPVYEEPFLVVLPQKHQWADRHSIPATELADEELLLLGPGHCFRDQVLQACPNCREPDAEDQPRAGSSLETIRHMVASGLGITVLPQSSIDPERDREALLVSRPFAGDPPIRRVALAWRKSFPRPKALAVLRKAIVECELRGVAVLPEQAPVDEQGRNVELAELGHSD